MPTAASASDTFADPIAKVVMSTRPDISSSTPRTRFGTSTVFRSAAVSPSVASMASTVSLMISWLV